MGALNGKIAVITGGSSGIGFATARRYKAEGATVVITGRNAERLTAAAEELGVLGVQGDVSNLDDLDRLVGTVRERFGQIDVLFLNAGVAEFAPVEGQTKESFDRLFAINVAGPYFAIQKALPLFEGGGSIIFNTSAVNTKGLPSTSVYAMTKAALRSLARTLASELAPRGIRVNAIAPGPVETPIYGKLGMPAEMVDEWASSLVSAIPLARFGQADEMAGPALFLASDDSSYVTGAELSADGGFSQV